MRCRRDGSSRSDWRTAPSLPISWTKPAIRRSSSDAQRGCESMNDVTKIETDSPTTDFVHRHIGPSPRDVKDMLRIVGAACLDELIAQTIPATIRGDALNIPPALSEAEALDRLRALASKNEVFTSL